VDSRAAFSDATATASGKHQEVLVLGLGNILLGDDGVGVHVVRRLAAAALPPGLQPLDGGTMGFRLMDVFAKSDAILLVDALQLGGRAGTIRLLETDALNRHVRRGGRVSAHEAGLIDLLTLARLEGCTPARVALLGIETQRIDWDEALSPPVTEALPAACRLAIETVLEWQQGGMTELASFADDGLVDALLMEVAGLLARLISHGESGAIDLRGLPLSSSCIGDLQRRLGTGEVSIQLAAAGRSDIHETGFPGVWWTRHADEAGRVIALLIEVTSVPGILLADAADMAQGLQRLPAATHVAAHDRARRA